MFGNEQIMAVLLEADDLRLVHRSWPLNMRLAVCLMPSGECQLMLFREEEAATFPKRLRKHLGLRSEELSIYPPVAGFPSRAVKYSDERSLAALLADTPGLLEDAHDYSVNFSYAVEEGLDPVAFLGVEVVAEDVEIETPFFGASKAQASADVLQFSSRRQQPVEEEKSIRNLRFDLAREAVRDVEGTSKPEPVMMDEQPADLGAEFLSADQLASIETPPGAYRLSQQGEWIEISRGEGAAVTVADPSLLFLRDDRALLAIRSDAVTSNLPANIRISVECLPTVLRRVLTEAIGEVHVSAENGFFYVALPLRSDDAQSVEMSDLHASLAQDETRRRWPNLRRNRGFRLFALTTITTLAIFVVLSAQPDDMTRQNSGKTPIDWSQFRLSMNDGLG